MLMQRFKKNIDNKCHHYFYHILFLISERRLLTNLDECFWKETMEQNKMVFGYQNKPSPFFPSPKDFRIEPTLPCLFFVVTLITRIAMSNVRIKIKKNKTKCLFCFYRRWRCHIPLFRVDVLRGLSADFIRRHITDIVR